MQNGNSISHEISIFFYLTFDLWLSVFLCLKPSWALMSLRNRFRVLMKSLSIFLWYCSRGFYEIFSDVFMKSFRVFSLNLFLRRTYQTLWTTLLIWSTKRFDEEHCWHLLQWKMNQLQLMVSDIYVQHFQWQSRSTFYSNDKGSKLQSNGNMWGSKFNNNASSLDLSTPLIVTFFFSIAVKTTCVSSDFEHKKECFNINGKLVFEIW